MKICGALKGELPHAICNLRKGHSETEHRWVSDDESAYAEAMYHVQDAVKALGIDSSHPDRRPAIHDGGVPMCSHMVCPSYTEHTVADNGNGARRGWCSAINATPDSVCIPAVRDMAAMTVRLKIGAKWGGPSDHVLELEKERSRLEKELLETVGATVCPPHAEFRWSSDAAMIEAIQNGLNAVVHRRSYDALRAWDLRLRHDDICRLVELTKVSGHTSDGYHTFDELYDHRVTLFLALCFWVHGARMPTTREPITTWRSKLHSDGTCIEGWFIMGIGKDPGKQITYHLPLARWDDAAMAEVLERAPEFDGHTSADVLLRLKDLYDA